MRFTSPTGAGLEVTPLRYAYEASSVCAAPVGEDADILIVRLDCRTSEGKHWSVTETLLLAGDLGSIASWCRSVATSEPKPEPLGFFEPCLSFEAVDQGIRVYFELEARPGWAPPEGAPMHDFWLDFPFDTEMLLKAAAEAEADDHRFPSRSSPAHSALGGGGLTMQ